MFVCVCVCVCVRVRARARAHSEYNFVHLIWTILRNYTKVRRDYRSRMDMIDTDVKFL